MAFADNLQQLPSIDHVAELRLLNAAGQVVTVIPNAPGKAGSLRLYAALAAKYGRIDVAAAQEGLVLFAEHTDDARLHPGNHPNIDRLLDIVATGEGYAAEVVRTAPNI